MRKGILAVLGLLLVAGSFLLARKLIKNKNKPRPTFSKLVKTVSVDTVFNKEIPIIITTSGNLTAKNRIELYAEVFEQENALEKLEKFASLNGANFYRLPINTQTITLEKQEWQVPKYLSFGKEALVPLRAGDTLHWCIKQ